MRKPLILTVVMLLLVSAAAWASAPTGDVRDTPAILSALGRADVARLDDAAAADVRGEAGPQYVLVKILGINTLDYGVNVQWTWDPLGYRYGNWGGPGWGNGLAAVDAMDSWFYLHDLVYAGTTDPAARLSADLGLLGGLKGLAVTPYPYWGSIYLSSPAGAPSTVSVFGTSLVGGKFFFGWRPMPYAEYSRREAVMGMQALLFGKSVLLRLQ